MSRKKKHGGHGGGGHAPLWMVSWADMATLMMCFFLLLISFADVNPKKIKTSLESIQSALSSPWPLPGGTGFLPEITSGPGKGKGDRENVNEVEKRIRAELEAKGLKPAVHPQVDLDGVNVVVLAPVLFESGTADFLPQAYEALAVIGDIVASYSNDVGVSGYVSEATLSAGSPYADDWELSGARAQAVLNYFIEKHGVDPYRIHFAGYGSHHPQIASKSELKRRLNDRVEVKLLTTSAGWDDAQYLTLEHEDVPDDTEIAPRP